jgi:biotin carboxylase
MGTPADGVLVVVGSGSQPYREYLLSAWARRRVWLLDQAPAGWPEPYLAGSAVVPRIRTSRLTSDVEALVEEVERIGAAHTVAGLITYEEMLVAATARAAARVGRPGLSVDGAENCRDKRRTRELLTAAGLPQPAFRHVAGSSEALRAAEAIGYPVVVKPLGLGGSIGVVKADRPGAVPGAYTLASEAARFGHIAHSGGALVESMLDGPEASIDGAVQDGEYRPMFAARKTVGQDPFFEETGHLVDPADPLLTDAGLLEMLRQAHRALGVRDGVTHTEVKLTAASGPVIVEVNGRLGGDFIPLLGRLATGVDAAAVAADAATGVPACWQAQRGAVAGVRFCYPPADGIVREVRLPPPGSVAGLVRARELAPPGTLLRLPPRGFVSRYACVICAAPDVAGCRAALDEAVAAVSVVLEPA